MSEAQTQGDNKPGWVGFDFDETLATKVPWPELGEPIPQMVRLARAYHYAGYEVRIVTARANPVDSDPLMFRAGLAALREWCHEHLRFEPKLVCSKDYRMLCLYDDRAIQVKEGWPCSLDYIGMDVRFQLSLVNQTEGPLPNV